MQSRQRLLNIINDRVVFCLHDPMRIMREITNHLDLLRKSYKFFINFEDHSEDENITRHLALGIPGGKEELYLFTNWNLAELKIKEQNKKNRAKAKN